MYVCMYKKKNVYTYIGIFRLTAVSGLRLYDRSCGGLRKPARRSAGLLPGRVAEGRCPADGWRPGR